MLVPIEEWGEPGKVRCISNALKDATVKEFAMEQAPVSTRSPWNKPNNFNFPAEEFYTHTHTPRQSFKLSMRKLSSFYLRLNASNLILANKSNELQLAATDEENKLRCTGLH